MSKSNANATVEIYDEDEDEVDYNDITNKLEQCWEVGKDEFIKRHLKVNLDLKYMADLLQQVNSSNKIKKMWKNKSSIHELNNAYKVCKSLLTEDKLQNLSNMCKSINNVCKGDGAGLTGGILIDMLLSRYFSQNLKDNYIELHSGESDMKISNTELSLKKINGKSTIALDWSKNETDNKKKYFNSHVVIVNLQTQTWWKSKPNKIISNKNITYNDEIKTGIYFIDKKYCKMFIKLSSNNKTNSLIDSQYLYLMLKRSMMLKLYIELPKPNKTIDFNILDAFSK